MISFICNGLDRPLYFYLIAVGVMTIVWIALRRRLTAGARVAASLFAGWWYIIIAEGIIDRTPGTTMSAVKLVPFWSYMELFRGNIKMLYQMLGNVLVFMPFGFLIPFITDTHRLRKSLLFGVCFSVFIELSQLVFQIGFFEFDDMMHNTLGTLLGYLLWRLCMLLIKRFRDRREVSNEKPCTDDSRKDRRSHGEASESVSTLCGKEAMEDDEPSYGRRDGGGMKC